MQNLGLLAALGCLAIAPALALAQDAPPPPGHFADLDADGNGLVTRQEMRSKLRQHRQEQRPRPGRRPL